MKKMVSVSLFLTAEAVLVIAFTPTHPSTPPPLSNSVQNFSSIVIMLLRYYYGIYKIFYKIYNFYNIMLIK
jgi:hypothetical protein